MRLFFHSLAPLAAACLLALGLLTTPAHADRRNYVWTYQYQTMPEKATELEFYQTSRLAEANDRWEYRIEVEHGLTSRWDVSIYQIFAQSEGGSLKYDAVQYRTRYRLGERGLWLVDPLLYFEYQRKTDLSQPNKVEAKLILARDISTLNLAVNPLWEFFFAPGKLHEAGVDIGASWEFHPAFSLGVESVSRWEFEPEETAMQSYFGPTVSFASAEWWASVGYAGGVSEEGDDARVRLLLGVGL